MWGNRSLGTCEGLEGLCAVSEGPMAECDVEDIARETSTWHFASVFLVIKLVSKLLVLLNLKKHSKRLRVVKLFKLAK